MQIVEDSQLLQKKCKTSKLQILKLKGGYSFQVELYRYMSKQDRLIQLIKNQNEDITEITLDSNLVEMGYNSFKFIELIVGIEIEFDLVFDDEVLDYRKYETIRDLVDFIAS